MDCRYDSMAYPICLCCCEAGVEMMGDDAAAEELAVVVVAVLAVAADFFLLGAGINIGFPFLSECFALDFVELDDDFFAAMGLEELDFFVLPIFEDAEDRMRVENSLDDGGQPRGDWNVATGENTAAQNEELVVVIVSKIGRAHV